MKRNLNSLTRAAAVTVALWLAAIQPCAGGITPTVLTLPDGYTQAVAVAVNGSGQIAGIVMVDQYSGVACRWLDGTPTILGLLEGGDGAMAKAINSSGVVVGSCTIASGGSSAVRWLPATTSPEALGAPGDLPRNEAVAINDQGQILCRSSSNDGVIVHWFLWEEGGEITEITMPNGGKIDPEGFSVLGSSGLLSSHGRVAGVGDVGEWQDGQWQLYYRAPVLWRKVEDEVSVIELSSADGDVTAVSSNGIVACYSSVDGYFLFDSNEDTYSPVYEGPTGSPNVSYEPMAILSVNDSGQAVFFLVAHDSEAVTATGEIWLWENGTWTEVPAQSLLSSGEIMVYPIVYINNEGQIAGTMFVNPAAYVAFAWDADTGVHKLLCPPSTFYGLALALNEAGQVVGGAAENLQGGGVIFPVTWELSGPPTTMVVQQPTVVARNSKTFTVTLALLNSTSTTAYDVTVTSASLDGVDSNSLLPLVFGAIKSGSSKKCTLQFKNVPSGLQILTLTGTSSLGDFVNVAELNVPVP